MIGDDMDKAVTDIVSMMLTMARLNGGEIQPIGVMLGDRPFMLKLEPVEEKPKPFPTARAVPCAMEKSED